MPEAPSPGLLLIMCSQHLLSIHDTWPDFQRHGTTAYSHSNPWKIEVKPVRLCYPHLVSIIREARVHILEEMNPWSKPKLSKTCSLSKQITQATKADPWMLPQASLVGSSTDLRVGMSITNPHLPFVFIFSAADHQACKLVKHIFCLEEQRKIPMT